MPDSALTAFVTPTYWADRANAERLCRSMDRHVAIPFRHFVIVPRRDLPLFRHLAGPSRTLLTKEEVIGRYGFRFLPVPRRVRIPGLVDRRFKEQWNLPGAGRLSGWVIQQIVKLAAPDFVADERIVYVDSDVELIRPLGDAHLERKGLLRLHEHDGGTGLATHRRWRDNALRLLGQPAEEGTPRNYIGHLIPWRRSNVVALQGKLEAVGGKPWWRLLAELKDFSEYILYGYFVARSADGLGHVREPLGLVHSLWVAGEAETERFRAGLTPDHVGVHIQSVLPMSEAERSAHMAALLPAGEEA